ncbi:MAG: CsbD family protein [Deltaproteobacteria bacterium]|nr:CsbD family protein [Deltaproteobacteria bacterium]
MNADTFKGNWKQLKGKVKEQWGKLTDDDLTQIDGKREQLVGKLQARYGDAKEDVESKVDEWMKKQNIQA